MATNVTRQIDHFFLLCLSRFRITPYPRTLILYNFHVALAENELVLIRKHTHKDFNPALKAHHNPHDELFHLYSRYFSHLALRDIRKENELGHDNTLKDIV